MNVHVQAYVQGRTAAEVFIPIQNTNKNPSPLTENVRMAPLPLTLLLLLLLLISTSISPVSPQVLRLLVQGPHPSFASLQADALMWFVD